MRVPSTATLEARAHADRARETVEGSDGPVWVRIVDDVWREAVARALAEATDVVPVRVPALMSPDAALHALAQAAATFGPRLLLPSLERGKSFSDRAAEAARWLAGDNRCVVVSSPTGFRQGRRGDPAPFADELDALYEAWSRARTLRSIWLAPTYPPPGFRGREAPRFDGTRPIETWLDACASTDVAALAEALVAASGPGARCSPTTFSAALAAVACGREPSRVARDLDAGRATMEAFGQTVGGVGERMAAAVALARALRVPVPRPVLADALGSETDAVNLLESMAWGDRELLVPAMLQWELPGGGETVDSRAHDVLAEHHLTLDGAPRPADVQRGAIVHWFEKVHHLGQGGESSVARWDLLDPPGPEFYWDRGRWLSIVRRDHAAAASVYRKCRERFKDDAYSWHYEAFNLERAGLGRGQAEISYHSAITLEPGNVWFNRRLITFYIGLGRFRAAEGAFGKALGRIAGDPRAPREDWYAENFHHDIARAWLLAGEIEAARKVLDELTPALVDDSPDLRRLAAEIADAEEAEELGESVYAPEVPQQRRWRRPQMLADADDDGAPLEDWSPGRVCEVAPDLVKVRFARRSDRVVLERTFSASEWRQVGFGAPYEGQFVEIGRYASGRVVVLPASPGGRRPAKLQQSAYLDRWCP